MNDYKFAITTYFSEPIIVELKEVDEDIEFVFNDEFKELQELEKAIESGDETIIAKFLSSTEYYKTKEEAEAVLKLKKTNLNK